MARALTETELELMTVLWRLGEATVREVREAMPPGRAYTTVATELGILAQKGFVSAELRGRGHVYRPLVAQSAYARSGLQTLIRRLFSGDPAALVRALVEDEGVTPDQMDAIRAELRKLEGG